MTIFSSRPKPLTESNSSVGFVFGEKLTDRVINADKNENTNPEKNSSENNEKESSDNQSIINKTVLWSSDVDAEKFSSDALENDSHTLLKLNCKLFILEIDKANWLERGYGILKVIETSDGSNCKISKTSLKFDIKLSYAIYFKTKLNSDVDR